MPDAPKSEAKAESKSAKVTTLREDARNHAAAAEAMWKQLVTAINL